VVSISEIDQTRSDKGRTMIWRCGHPWVNAFIIIYITMLSYMACTAPVKIVKPTQVFSPPDAPIVDGSTFICHVAGSAMYCLPVRHTVLHPVYPDAPESQDAGPM
jgi:hypothetical protein